MFFGILQPYIIDIYGFYFEEYMHGYLCAHCYNTGDELKGKRDWCNYLFPRP